MQTYIPNDEIETIYVHFWQMKNESIVWNLPINRRQLFPSTKHETFVRNVARVAFRIAATDSFIYSIGCADVLRPLFPSSSAGIQPPRFSPRSADRLFILARPIKTNNFRSSRGCTSQTCKHRVSAFAVAERRLYRIYERLPVIFLFHVPRSPTFLGLNKYFVNSDISSRIILVSLLLLNIPWNESWRRVGRIKNCHGRSMKLLFQNNPEIVVTHDPSFLPLTDEIGDVDGESSRLDWTSRSDIIDSCPVLLKFTRIYLSARWTRVGVEFLSRSLFRA